MPREKSERLSRHDFAVSRVDALATSVLTVRSGGEGFIDITDAVRDFLVEANG